MPYSFTILWATYKLETITYYYKTLMRFTSLLLASALFVATQGVQISTTVSDDEVLATLQDDADDAADSLEDTEGSLRRCRMRTRRPPIDWPSFWRRIRESLKRHAEE